MSRIRILTKANFSHWLKSKKPGASVGIPGDPCRCPVAKFLTASGLKKVWINNVHISHGQEDNLVKTPTWVTKLILSVDRIGDNKITAKVALQLLG